ncbi:MAG: hypothetical protein IKE74_03475 [Mogibacterium sp.]|nr:hypothetical protein [Mogibacterium sp.]
MAELKYEIRRHLAVLNRNERTGWTKEANVVAWNDGAEKLDIRDWNPDHSKMSRGVTLSEDEARILSKALIEVLGR